MLANLLVALALAAPTPEQTAEQADGFWRYFDVVGAAHFQAPSPFLALGGRLGLGLDNQVAELGGEVTYFLFPRSDEAFGVALGGYLQVAPVPISWGKRIYLHGRLYRAFATGLPRFDAWGAGWGLGYRHPFDHLGGSRYLFIEVGMQRAWLFRYEEALWVLDVVKLGVAW
jgi:hypothetical protein